MPVVVTDHATTHVGELATRVFQYGVYIQGLKVEERFPGMKLTRGPSMLSRAKKVTGLRTNNRQAHIDWFTTQIADLRARDVK